MTNDMEKILEPHAIGCTSLACKGQCLRPRTQDSLEIRMLRYEDAQRARERARIARIRASDAVDAAKRALLDAEEAEDKASDALRVASQALAKVPS